MMKRKILLKFFTTLLASALLTFPLVACDKEEPQPDEKPASTTLKIMTFNVLNGWNTSNIGERDDVTAAKILELAPDVVGLQEFDDYYRNASGTPLSALISEKYTEVNADKVSWNPVFYNKETVEPISFGFEDYSLGTSYDTYNYKGQVGSKFRTITWALFTHKASGKQFLVLNTHLDVEKEKQPSQVSELKNHVTKLKKELEVSNVFLMGDLNSNVTSTTAQNLFNYGFKDTHELAENKDDLNSCGKQGVAVSAGYNWAIDHIYCIGSNIIVSNYTTVTDIRETSDHCPVSVTVTLNE